MTKISVLNEGLKTIDPNDAFKDHISPPVKTEVVEQEIVAQDEQTFLKAQQALLGRPSDEARRA